MTRDGRTRSGGRRRGLPSREAWRLAAERHLNTDLLNYACTAPDHYVHIVDALTVSMWAEAVEVEKHRPGSGLQAVLSMAGDKR